MKLNVVDLKGKTTSTMSTADEIFAAPLATKLVAQVVHVYLSNQRQGTAKALRRGEVYGSRRKVWRQKGTGRARHGDRFSPIFVGGGSAHGPTGKQNWKRKINTKMRRLALFSVLSQKRESGSLIVIDDLPKLKKTKDAQKVLTNLASRLPTLVVVAQVLPETARAMRNLEEVKLITPSQLHTTMVLGAKTIILTKEAIGAIQKS